jgi:hypothetical protein
MESFDVAMRSKRHHHMEDFAADGGKPTDLIGQFSKLTPAEGAV